MYQAPLPSKYADATDEALIADIQAAKSRLGDDLVILTHHYQRPEIVALGHVRGDSLKLAQYAAAQTRAKWIVYCGVHFMAESADILKTGDQSVILPDMGAGCDMADMADADDVAEAWQELVDFLGHEQIVPVTYINSTAALKAFVGRKNGIVCTSTNATKILQWAFDQNKMVYFFPDQHLGRNTAKAMGVPMRQIRLWEPNRSLGGNTPDELRQTKVLLWRGHCPVHAMFSLKQIENLKSKDSAFKIISHPECVMEVVDASEFVGSTEYIVQTIANAPAGSKWAVGTEMNLVNRIALENPDKTVVSINPYMCLCGTMNRIDLNHLAWCLDEIINGTPQNVIAVEQPDRQMALETLNRMLRLS